MYHSFTGLPSTNPIQIPPAPLSKTWLRCAAGGLVEFTSLGHYLTLASHHRKSLSRAVCCVNVLFLINGRHDWQPQPDAATLFQPPLQTESPITTKLSWTASAVTAAAGAQRAQMKINTKCCIL